jgi:hypothetical protein
MRPLHINIKIVTELQKKLFNKRGKPLGLLAVLPTQISLLRVKADWNGETSLDSSYLTC